MKLREAVSPVSSPRSSVECGVKIIRLSIDTLAGVTVVQRHHLKALRHYWQLHIW